MVFFFLMLKGIICYEKYNENIIMSSVY